MPTLMKRIERRCRACLLGLALLVVAAPSHAQDGPPQNNVSKVGTTAGEFLQVGVGPRAMAMGGAFVAASDDITSLYWNPAGIASVARGEVFFTHSEWLAEINFDYVGGAYRLGNLGTIGASVTVLSVPEMIVRTEERQEGTGETFDAMDLAVGLSYGLAVTDRFSVGVTGKFIQQRIWHSTATGFAVDLGTKFRTDFFGGLTIGATLYNFGTDMRMNGRDLRTFVDENEQELGDNDQLPANFETDAWSLPLNFQIGVSSRPVNTRMHQLTVTADALHPSSNYESMNVGFEYGFMQRFFMRGGYQSLFLQDSEGGISGGIGVRLPLFYEGGMGDLGYAYRSVGSRLGGVHVVSLGLSF
jgi:hypothetical protein